jgi:hypothetical protein
MAWGVKGEAFKNKQRVTLYFDRWVRKKLKFVGNQSTFVQECVLKCNPDWKKPGPDRQDDEDLNKKEENE